MDRIEEARSAPAGGISRESLGLQRTGPEDQKGLRTRRGRLRTCLPRLAGAPHGILCGFRGEQNPVSCPAVGSKNSAHLLAHLPGDRLLDYAQNSSK